MCCVCGGPFWSTFLFLCQSGISVFIFQFRGEELYFIYEISSKMNENEFTLTFMTKAVFKYCYYSSHEL